MAISYKVKCSLTIWHRKSTPGYLLKRNKHMYAKESYKHIPSNFFIIAKTQKLYVIKLRDWQTKCDICIQQNNSQKKNELPIHKQDG